MHRVIAYYRSAGFALDEGGATSIEYALIACGISIAIISAVTSVGSTMMNIYYDKLLNLFGG